MKAFSKITLSILCTLFFVSISFSQKIEEEIQVNYTIETDGGDDPMMSMMDGSKFVLAMSKEKNIVKMDLMSGMMVTIIVSDNLNALNNYMLMTMLGQKYKITDLNAEEVDDSNEFLNFSNFKSIEYFKSKTKTIAGYKCYLAKAVNEDDEIIELYITDKIQTKDYNSESGANELKAFPLEITTEIESGVKIIFTTSSVDIKLDEELIPNQEGYTEMTMEEFSKMGF